MSNMCALCDFTSRKRTNKTNNQTVQNPSDVIPNRHQTKNVKKEKIDNAISGVDLSLC